MNTLVHVHVVVKLFLQLLFAKIILLQKFAKILKKFQMYDSLL